ncbi:MAG: ABC transporter substrate-binding protein [Alphaproteobacteria bacterium]|nr:ABC transporter substrate-binding protein [Alphaproteobacteria bacterium]
MRSLISLSPACRLVFVLALMLPAAAQAATPAEIFVSTNIERGLQILGSDNPQRSSRFESFLEGLTDISRIGRFTLGNARRTASPQDLAAFDTSFRNYAVAVYQSRLSKYSGQTLKVTGSVENGPGDFTVSTVMVDPEAKSDQQPLPVGFRVVNEGNRMVVIDVSVAGVWLSIEERDQFSAFLSQHNGSIPALIQHLNQLTTQLRNGGPAQR